MGFKGKLKKKIPHTHTEPCGLSWADFPWPSGSEEPGAGFMGTARLCTGQPQVEPSFLTTAGCELSSTPLWSGEHPGMVYKTLDFKPYSRSLS